MDIDPWGSDLCLKKSYPVGDSPSLRYWWLSVIFSIMAAMIAMILNTTMRTRQGNIDLENEIAEQKEKYYLNTQKTDYTAKDGTIQLNFYRWRW